ncbi:MAG: glycosyl transferase [Micavibrio aeruginosavorus]|uniref:Glycosyl transferase n=1 Tax=Micavibrio aeruginosavorus TaxID=349221 RepID=A0A2W5HPB6_9BACT|nr:MAG: glycosyl transferase [Micavibrio aeruginosavorus]
MKVLQVMAGAEQGGAETAFIDTCLALKEAGVEIEVAARANKGRNPRLEEAGIKIHTLPFGGKVDFYTTWKLKQIIKDFDPVIVQTWMSRGTVKTPASKDGKYLKVSRLGGYYDLKYYKTSDYFIANTPDIKSYLLREGVVPSRVVHINNYAPAESAAPVSREELSTPDKVVIVLALARLHENKALDILIRAVEDLPDIHVWIAGVGPLQQELEELSCSLGIPERIHFLGWRNDRAALMAASDIVCVPSRHEPFGNVFVQAWANKVPLITSNSEGPSQYVHDEEDALVFAVDDVDGLKSALRELSANETLQRKLSENGYQRYLGEFTKEKTVETYLKFYKDILARESLIR